MTTTARVHDAAGWLRANGIEGVSPLGEEVAAILGAVWAGIYHISKEVLHPRVEWNGRHCITVTVRGELATTDSWQLSHLVILCAARGVRLAVRGAAPEYLRLQFTKGETMFYGKYLTPQEMVDRWCPAEDLPV
jgi:hypothetical protein